MKVSTEITRLAPGRYVRMAIGVWLGRWWWVVAVPLVALGVMGMADPVWYIAALAYVMLLCPTVMMIVYFNAALRPLAAFATMPHRISLDSNGSITIDYYENNEEDVISAPGDGRNPMRADALKLMPTTGQEDYGPLGDDAAALIGLRPSPDAEKTLPKPIRQLHFGRGEVARVEDHGNNLVVVLRSSPYDFIVVPCDALSPENLQKFIDLLPSTAKIG